MRRAFTLIELLSIVAIIGIMVTASIVNVRAGQGAARIRAATRDILATIRHARSVALVTQQPSVITYSIDRVDDEVCAKVEIDTARIFGSDTVKSATTLDGATVTLVDDGEGGGDGASGEGGGQTVEDVLFAPISSDVVRGVRLKVLKEGEDLDYSPDEAKAKPKISVFSNVDYLIGKLRDSRMKEAAAKAAEEDEPVAAPAASDLDDQEPVSVVWEVNGRTEPHRVWVYPDGSSPEKGLCIKIDRFGAAKVLGSGEDD
jgi:type II secretory pathway pseudopilin PulG